MKNKLLEESLEQEKELEQAEQASSDVVKEPAAVYGIQNVFIDKEKRYTYADYLTWLDDKRRELYNGIVHDLFEE